MTGLKDYGIRWLLVTTMATCLLSGCGQGGSSDVADADDADRAAKARSGELAAGKQTSSQTTSTGEASTDSRSDALDANTAERPAKVGETQRPADSVPHTEGNSEEGNGNGQGEDGSSVPPRPDDGPESPGEQQPVRPDLAEPKDKPFSGDGAPAVSPRAEVAISGPFRRLHEHQFEEHSFSVTPQLIDGTLIIADYEGHVSAIDLQTGDLRWEFQGDKLGYEAPPVYRDGRLYAVAYEGIVDCIDAASGDSLWTVNCENPVTATPVIFKDRLLICTHSGEMICLNLVDGAEQWRFMATDQIHSPPLVVGEKILVVAACSRIMHIVDLDGNEEQQIDLPGETAAPLVVIDDDVYLTTMYGEAVCYDWRKTTKVWSHSFNPELEPQMEGGPLIDGNTLYVGGTDSFIRAFDIEKRREIWKRRIKGSIETPLVLSNGVIFGITIRGRIYGLHADSGEVVWQYESSGDLLATPLVVNDTLVFGNREGKLYQFGPISALHK